MIDLWTNTVLAEFDYAIGNNTNEIWFTTEGNYENVVVRSYVSTDDVVSKINEKEDTSKLLKISSYTLKSAGAVCSDAKWTIFFFLLIFILIGYGIYRMVILRKPALLMVTIMALVTSLPFFNDYLPSGHDWKFHISRIFSLGESFVDGQIPQHMNVSMATVVFIVFLAHPMRFVKRAKRILWIVSAAVLTVLINLWFLVPFLQFFVFETKISSNATIVQMQFTTPYLWQVFSDTRVSGKAPLPWPLNVVK